MKKNPKENKKIYVRKKNKWVDYNSGNYHYINQKENSVNNARINNKYIFNQIYSRMIKY